MLFLNRKWLEPKLLGLLAVASAVLWFFIDFSSEVIEGDTIPIDQAILLSFRAPDDPNKPLGPLWVSEFFRDISGLGGPFVLGLLILATIAFFLLRRQSRTAIFVAISSISGTVLSVLLKLAFDRPRPELVAPLTHASGNGFPSGHAMMSAMIYLTVGALIAQSTSEMRLKVFIMGVAVTLTGLIGISRVYLGVHWPSDVLAGWVAGSFWALLSWIIAQTANLEHRTSV